MITVFNKIIIADPIDSKVKKTSHRNDAIAGVVTAAKTPPPMNYAWYVYIYVYTRISTCL
jgi:hypothetical protein